MAVEIITKWGLRTVVREDELKRHLDNGAKIAEQLEFKPTKVETKVINKEPDDSDDELFALVEEYESLAGKNVSPRYSKDKEWLTAKIAELKNL